MKAAPGSADRELRAETVVDAPPDRVWALLSDVSRMPRLEPRAGPDAAAQARRDARGQWYLGINRRKGVVWPTRNVVAVLEPGRTLAWDTKTERRPVDLGDHARPARAPASCTGARCRTKLTLLSKVFAQVFLGGGAEHADELEAGMAQHGRPAEGGRGALSARTPGVPQGKSAVREHAGQSRGSGRSDG